MRLAAATHMTMHDDGCQLLELKYAPENDLADFIRLSLRAVYEDKKKLGLDVFASLLRFSWDDSDLSRAVMGDLGKLRENGHAFKEKVWRLIAEFTLPACKDLRERSLLGSLPNDLTSPKDDR